VTEVTLGADKRITLDGASAGPEVLGSMLPVLAFTPDRLAVVKGGPAIRRAYLDRAIGRAVPRQATLPGEYAHALAQRNAALRRARAGLSSTAAVGPWTEAVAQLGSELDAARTAFVAALLQRFSARAAELGLESAGLSYRESGITVAGLETRFALDLERATTGLGPHLCDLDITSRGVELRAFGSQGEQRLAVLALLLGEADLSVSERSDPPLLLLDDVLSELDNGRRAALVASLPLGAQTLITTTTLQALPSAAPQPALVVEVCSGRAAIR
jgi:DNA replication and repair protein RecF